MSITSQRLTRLVLVPAVASCVVGCQSATSPPLALGGYQDAIVEASCGQCQFDMRGDGCDLAVRIDGASYFVDGTGIDDHGDAHAADGFCNTILPARVTGRIENHRFMVASFALVQEPDDPMAVAAGALLESLDDDQRDRCTYDFSDAERRNWQPVPFGTAGVRLDRMNDEQRSRVHGLLSSALSESGVATVEGVLLLERILLAMQAQRGQRDSVLAEDRYFVTIYGDPRSESPWGWRMEGHHLSITFTCRNNQWTAHGPIFVGSQPARVRGGEHHDFRLLGVKDDNARAFLASLNDEQRAGATATGRLPGNIILLPGRNDGFAEVAGVAGRDLTDAQRTALFEVITDWARWLRDDLAQAEIERMKAGLNDTYFLWMGATGVDEPHYWRVVGSHFAIEYAAPERDPDHVHAIWRDIENDFGGHLLQRHLEEHHTGADH